MVLVHGLWMHGAALALMRWRLSGRGLSAGTFSYPSVCAGLDDNALALAGRIRALAAGAPVDLVGHSLGGLLILRMLALRPALGVRRVVLLGAPVQGSRAAEVLRAWPPTARLLGRSIQDWQRLAPPRWPISAEVGVLAGTRSLGTAHFIRSIERPNDGVVALAETRLDGALDEAVRPVGHSQMLFSRRIADDVAGFLRDGRFPASTPPAGQREA